jgi:hypothetical protein
MAAISGSGRVGPGRVAGLRSFLARRSLEGAATTEMADAPPVAAREGGRFDGKERDEPREDEDEDRDEQQDEDEDEDEDEDNDEDNDEDEDGDVSDSDESSVGSEPDTPKAAGADKPDMVKIPVGAVPAYIARVGDELAVDYVCQRRRGHLPSEDPAPAPSAPTRGPAQKVLYHAQYRCSRGKAQALKTRKAKQGQGAAAHSLFAHAETLPPDADRACPPCAPLLDHQYGSSTAPKRAARRGARRGSSLKGSKKVGCEAYLTVTVLTSDPSNAVVQLHRTHSHATGGMATAADLWVRMMAPELQAWILQSFTVVRDIEVIYRILNIEGAVVPAGTACRARSDVSVLRLGSPLPPPLCPNAGRHATVCTSSSSAAAAQAVRRTCAQPRQYPLASDTRPAARASLPGRACPRATRRRPHLDPPDSGQARRQPDLVS